MENTNNAEGRLAELGGLEVRERRNQSTCSRRHESTAGPTFRRRARGRYHIGDDSWHAVGLSGRGSAKGRFMQKKKVDKNDVQKVDVL